MRLAIAMLAAMSANLLAGTPRVPEDHWGKNLVPNPGLELDAPGWDLPPGQCAWDASEKHSGARSLRFTNTDRNLYRLVTAPVALIPGVRYRISAWVKGKDVRGDAQDQGAGLCIEWSDAKGQWLGGHYPSCKPGTFDWTRLAGETGAVPANAASGHVVLYLRKHSTGTAWFDDVEVTAIRGPALDFGIVSPHYRATVSRPTEGKKLGLRLRLNLAEHDLPERGLAFEASVATADGRVLATRRSPRLAETQEATYWVVDLPELAAGRYTLAAGLLDAESRRLGEPTTAAFRVAEPIPRKVTLDETGRLVVEGKPFFPLGLYLGPTEDEHLDRIAKAGFNTILCYGYGPGKDPRAYLDRAAKHGLKVIYSIKDFYEGSTWYPKQGGKSGLDLMRKYVAELRDHPALLAWYTNDELGPEWMPKLQAAYDLVCDLDPDHPAFQVLCVPSQNALYYGVTDILGVDPYPIPRHPVTMVGEWMDTARAAMWWAKPAWCVPQIFQWANYSKDAKDREPTFEEKRAMVCLALIHGAQGLICYSYYDLFKGDDKGVFERRWKEVSAIAGEVAKLIPVLLDGKEVAADLKGVVRYRALEHNGSTRVIAVNTSPKPLDATIELPKTKWSRRLAALETVVDTAK
ncbi:MAG TPA: hypothetical protein VNE39_00905 [Planctomycetota bacterium]|nr:hypothetical protein [Planctomycetota bacterium]